MKKHNPVQRLAPSSTARWTQCPSSVAAERAPSDSVGDAARHGVEAHERMEAAMSAQMPISPDEMLSSGEDMELGLLDAMAYMAKAFGLDGEIRLKQDGRGVSVVLSVFAVGQAGFMITFEEINSAEVNILNHKFHRAVEQLKALLVPEEKTE